MAYDRTCIHYNHQRWLPAAPPHLVRRCLCCYRCPATDHYTNSAAPAASAQVVAAAAALWFSGLRLWQGSSTSHSGTTCSVGATTISLCQQLLPLFCRRQLRHAATTTMTTCGGAAVAAGVGVDVGSKHRYRVHFLFGSYFSNPKRRRCLMYALSDIVAN